MLTYKLPFTVAGCCIRLQDSTVDETSYDDSDAGTASVRWSQARETLLQDATMHAASLKLALFTLARLVSGSCLFLITLSYTVMCCVG